MKNLCTILALSFFVMHIAQAQERVPVDLAKGQFYLTLLNPGVAYEFGLSDRNSVYLDANILPLSGARDDGDTGIDDFFLTINPSVGFSVRNYYARKRVKKQLKNNSGNYIGLTGRYIFNSIYDNSEFDNITINRENSFIGGAVWGMQRNYQSGIFLGLELGSGLSVGENRDLGFEILVDFKFGFTIGGRKAKMPESWVQTKF